MNILKLLLSIFANDDKLKTLVPFIDLLSKNSFDLGKTLKNLDLDALAPIVKAFMENAQQQGGRKENPTDFSVGNGFYLNPIASLADKEIVYTLNKFFA